jgi:dihydropteroate synthase
MKQNTQIFGILNITPDSYYDGGLYQENKKAIAHALQMQEDGADWIDVGGESTRPGASFVTLEEEIERVIPVIRELKKQLKIPISIDTYKPEVARLAIEAGASMINDISGLSDPEMVKIAIDYNVPVCVMHMQGSPENMQIAPSYPRGIIPELLEWFERKIDHLLKSGMKSENIILDPGIGFGKTPIQNMEIIKNIAQFKRFGLPLFLGLSRKSFIMHYVKKPREELLPATIALASFSVQQRVDYLRVHDVGSHRDTITILDGLTS